MEHGELARIQRKVAEVLEEQGEVLFAYIFGSTAAGTDRKGSDVDIAVYIDPKRHGQAFNIRLRLIEKLTRVLSRQVDAVILNTASPFLRYVVLKEGKLVLERVPEARIDFELKALNEYFDYKPILKLYQDRLKASV